MVPSFPLSGSAVPEGVTPRRRFGDLTIRSRLALLVVACVFPVWLAAGFLISYAYQAKRTLITANMLETARALALTVDQKLLSIQAGLRVLATSPHVSTRDFAALHAQARQVLTDYPEADIIMADASGQQVVNTYRSFGEPLPRRAVSETVRQVFATGRPVLSDLFRGAVTGRPLIGIDVPVLVDGTVAYDLAMTLPAEHLTDILWRQHLSEGWLGEILDSRGVVASCNRHPERFVGERSPLPLLDMLAAQPEGVIGMATGEGGPQTFVYSRSPVTGWAVAIGLSTDKFWGEVHSWLWWTVSAATLLSLLGLLLAFRMARRIANSIQALAAPAAALGRGEAVSIGAGMIPETKAVAEAMAEASQCLRQRAGERDQAEEALRLSRDALKEAFDSLQTLNADLDRARAEAETANHAKSAFLAAISHELRTPLTAIIGFAEIIRSQSQGPVGNPVYVDYAADILDGGRQLKARVDDVIDFVKIESRRMELAPIPMTVATLVNGVLRQVGNAAGPCGIALESRLAPDLGELWGDERAVTQILLKLLANAIKFTREGGTVTVSAAAVDGGIVLTVADTGIGIPADRMGELMLPLHQINSRYTRSAGGAGLGLSLVRGLVELHHGRVDIDSAPGVGTRVRVFFPARPDRL